MGHVGLSVDDLSVSSVSDRGEVEVVTDMSFDVSPGEAIAIVGESGSGKSLTAKSVLGLLPDSVNTAGHAVLGGADLLQMSEKERDKLRGTGLAVVLQDPFTMLNPLERCGEQVVARLRGEDGRSLDSGERLRLAVERLREVGITDSAVAERYPFELSGGMRQRVGIAAAIAQNPSVLIADEPTTALDVTTQKEILDLLSSLCRTHEMGLVLITHDLRVAFSTCNRVYVLYAGTLLETGPGGELATDPAHPYSLGLLLADPPMDRRVSPLHGIPGTVPAPGHRPAGCRFAPRCSWSTEKCEAALPPLVDLGDSRLSRCVRISEIREEMRERRRAAEQALSVEAEQPRPAGDDIVAAKSIVKVFGGGRQGREVRALDDVSIRVGVGECVGLVGESGSGKTTLGRIVVGLETATEGEVSFDGESAGDGAVRARDIVQMVFQDPYSSLNPARTIGATVGEALRLGGHSRSELDGEVGRLLQKVGIQPSYARRRPAQLSGGERQRVAIARAIARRPRMLVCDEVVSALDVSVQAQILNLLRELRSDLGLSYVFISHDLAVVRQVADRVYVLYRGELVEEGPTDAILDNPTHPYTRRLVGSIPRPIQA